MQREELQGGRDGVVKERSWTGKDSCCCRYMAEEQGGGDGACCPLIVQKGSM